MSKTVGSHLGEGVLVGCYILIIVYIFITLMCTIPSLEVVINNKNVKKKEAFCFIDLQEVVHKKDVT